MRRAILKGLVAIGLAATLGFGAAAQTEIDPENVLVIEIAGEGAGIVEILMRPDVAPLHVAQIKALARSGAYDGIVFHRVINGFMAQTGDVELVAVDQANALSKVTDKPPALNQLSAPSFLSNPNQLETQTELLNYYGKQTRSGPSK